MYKHISTSKFFFIFLLLFLLINKPLHSQVSDQNGKVYHLPAIVYSTHQSLELVKIEIEGNNKTQPFVIKRELSFKEGDNINLEEIENRLERDRQNVFNTALFNKVDIHPELHGTDGMIIRIVVDERWYLFPLPIFELVDRNFNEWWFDHGRDLRRTIYGFYFSQKNFRGRKEELRILTQFGYTQKFEISYDIPYISIRETEGVKFSVSYSNNKSTSYSSFGNKLQFAGIENLIRQRFEASIRLNFREGIYFSNSLEAAYNYNTIHDTISQLNPDYFGDGSNIQQYLMLNYSLTYNRRDIKAYPLNGYYFAFNAQKVGLGIYNDVNILRISSNFHKYFDLGSNFYFSSRLKGFHSIPEKQPFNLINGLGYSQTFVRGYEHYVVDGSSYALVKTTFKKQLFSFEQDLSKIISVKQFQKLPLAAYFKIFFDAGYVDNHDPEFVYPLANQFLFGTGVGIDFVSFYDNVFRIEYSMNRMKEHGLFLHFVADI